MAEELYLTNAEIIAKARGTSIHEVLMDYKGPICPKCLAFTYPGLEPIQIERYHIVHETCPLDPFEIPLGKPVVSAVSMKSLKEVEKEINKARRY